MTRALIRKGDMTTHGGKVIEGFSDYTIQGIPVAGVGHKTICPLCQGVYPIVQGYSGMMVNGILVALEGGLTACGAKLIPSQREEVVDDGGGSEGYATLSDKPATQKSMINDGVYRPDQDNGKVVQTAAEEQQKPKAKNYADNRVKGWKGDLSKEDRQKSNEENGVCDKIREEIDKIINSEAQHNSGKKGLKQRFHEQESGEQSGKVFDDHDEIMRRMQKDLGDYIDQLDKNGCGPPSNLEESKNGLIRRDHNHNLIPIRW